MRIKFNTIKIEKSTGYGKAAAELVTALSNYVDISDRADIILNFCMPPQYEYRDITIGYTPWESTKIKDSWYEPIAGVDDLWSTSSWTAEVFEKLLHRSVFILPHGLSEIWKPVRHEMTTPFTFLHVGEPAVRKGGELVLDAWYRAFANKSNYKLIYKTVGIPRARVKDGDGSIIAAPGSMNNVEVINQKYSELEMWALFARSHCMVYPTRGEGFGLIPAEAIASGIPTILPQQGGTSDFSKWGIPLTSTVWKDSNEVEHPGLWMDHDVDEIIRRMNCVIHDYNAYSKRAYQNGGCIRKQLDWDRIAQIAVNRIESLT